jgi:hypothetical protein
MWDRERRRWVLCRAGRASALLGHLQTLSPCTLCLRQSVRPLCCQEDVGGQDRNGKGVARRAVTSEDLTAPSPLAAFSRVHHTPVQPEAPFQPHNRPSVSLVPPVLLISNPCASPVHVTSRQRGLDAAAHPAGRNERHRPIRRRATGTSRPQAAFQCGPTPAGPGENAAEHASLAVVEFDVDDGG